jgi:hypothetical protein
MTQEEQLMYVLATIVQNACGEIWITEEELNALDTSKPLMLEYHGETSEIRIALEDANGATDE